MTTLLALWHRFLAWLRGDPPKPALVWFDSTGTGWRAPPDYQEPWVEDTGQHEVRKREMRIFLWRAIRNLSAAPHVLDPATIGLGGSPDRVPRLWPMGQELAATCRRHGFATLARAAMPEASEVDLRRVWTTQHAAMIVEVDRMMAGCAEVAKTWNPVHGPPPGEPREALIANLDCGPYEVDGEIEGRKRAGMKPMRLLPGWPRTADAVEEAG